MANGYDGGSAVRSGYYLDVSRLHIEPVAHDGDRLPGGGRWMRVPTAAALALVPVLGAAFVVFLPFVGIALVLRALAAPALDGFRTSATEIAATVGPGWQPGEAHFTGIGPDDERNLSFSARDERLDALAREIEARRLHLHG